MAVCKHVRRVLEIWYSHAGVQHLNKISNGDALELGDLQQFNDSAFYKLRVRLCQSHVHNDLPTSELPTVCRTAPARLFKSAHFLAQLPQQAQALAPG